MMLILFSCLSVMPPFFLSLERPWAVAGCSESSSFDTNETSTGSGSDWEPERNYCLAFDFFALFFFVERISDTNFLFLCNSFSSSVDAWNMSS